MAVSDLFETARVVWPAVKRAALSGQLLRPQCRLTKAHPDIFSEHDVEIPMAEGFHLTASVFRSRAAADRGESRPVVMCAHPYDNHLTPALGKTPLGGPPQQYRLVPQVGAPEFSELTSWEAPDPNFWVPAGYTVVNLNLPGYANSGGKPTIFSLAQADCFAQAIDWVGEQDWCTGGVGLNGVSYLAISQYAVAAGQAPGGVPKALRAICPWEGLTNIYADMAYEGGVPEEGFPVFWWHTEVKPTLNCSEAEFVASEGVHPTRWADEHAYYDDYWRAKTPDLAAIRVPMLVCASFSDQGLHTRGSFRAFRKAASEQKWVYTHRTLKWDAYYSREVQELTRRFFDCFVKGESDPAFLDTPPVRLEVRSSRDRIHEVRHEREWPLERTDYRRLFLAAGSRELHPEPPDTQGELSWSGEGGDLQLVHAFDADTEITGYMKLRLFVSARASDGGAAPDDMTIFVAVDKLDSDGERVPFYGSVGNFQDAVTRGLLRVSRRRLDEAESTEWEPVLTNDRDEPLSPGEIVAVDIALNPSSTWFERGEVLRLTISSREIIPSMPYKKSSEGNRGLHVIHTGPERASYLLVPHVPAG